VQYDWRRYRPFHYLERDIRMKFNPPKSHLDQYVSAEVLKGLSYPPPKIVPDQIKTIVDIGACTGAAAHYFRILWPYAEIHCYEPNPACWEELSLNAPFAHIHRMGLGRERRVMTMKHDSQALCLSKFDPEGTEACYIEEARVAFEQNHPSPDLIKMDVEGMEEDVINSAYDYFKQAKLLYIEAHSWEYANTLIKWCQDRDFVPFSVYSLFWPAFELAFIKRGLIP
jgi:FkbM family methyltransferase